jgi:hypothetical protein
MIILVDGGVIFIIAVLFVMFVRTVPIYTIGVVA